VQLLLENEADVNVQRNGATTLMWAAHYGNEAVVRLLLEIGADVNAMGGLGTALMWG
jgi:ankyrin repeat protein